jgi:prepilin-type N-terminal cleavage/methylation domain-containing protein
MPQHKTQGFTLVELIVVVTILAILATIWFVSYSSYLTWVRDTNRIAQLTSISDWLNLYSTKNDLPIPDNNVEVSVSWALIAYQGTAGANTLETIDFSKWWKDPKDDTHFSYYLTKNRKYFQLMAFLEESENITSWIVNTTHAIDYTDRIPTVSWKKLGILTNNAKVPVEQLGSDLNISSWLVWYVSHLSSNLYWEGGALINLDALSKEWGYKESLLLWFDMETAQWTEIYDLSWNGNNAQIIWSAVTIGDSPGVFGNSTAYNVVWGHQVPYFSELQDSSSLTVSIWSKTDSQPYAYNTLINQWDCSWWCWASWDYTWSIGETNASAYDDNNVVLSLWASGLPASERLYPQPRTAIYGDSQWHHFVVTKSQKAIKFYVNWVLVDSSNTDEVHIRSGLPLYIGTSGHTLAFDTNAWQIDDVRIYGAELDAKQINNLYVAGSGDL